MEGAHQEHYFKRYRWAKNLFNVNQKSKTFTALQSSSGLETVTIRVTVIA